MHLYASLSLSLSSQPLIAIADCSIRYQTEPTAIEQRLAREAPQTCVHIVHADLGDTASVKGIFPAALQTIGHAKNVTQADVEISVVVNCAGIQRRAPAVQFKEEDWDDVSTSSWFFFGSFSSLLVLVFPFSSVCFSFSDVWVCVICGGRVL